MDLMNPETQSPGTVVQCISPLGLYVHVPFCATTCDFCAFVQSKPDRPQIVRFLDAVDRESRRFSSQVNRSVDTIFWGGGTPGLLLPKDLKQLGEIMLRDWVDATPVEWTVEMAPATVNPAKRKTLKQLGVNRISMGVQSFDDATLEIMRRQHSVNQVRRAYDWIRDAVFEHVNLDMIIAFPGQSESQLLDDLEKAVQLDPDHLSTYCLTFEEDTPLYAKMMKGIYKPDSDREAQLYESTWNYLGSRGYRQYEVSNFAKPGHHSVHNLNTWRMHEWIGLGPSASSQHDWKRWTGNPDFNLWEQGIEDGTTDVDRVELNRTDLLSDCWIFGLRTNEGVRFEDLHTRFGPEATEAYWPLLRRLVQEGLAEMDSERVCLTMEGRLKADAIGVELLSLDP